MSPGPANLQAGDASGAERAGQPPRRSEHTSPAFSSVSVSAGGRQRALSCGLVAADRARRADGRGARFAAGAAPAVAGAADRRAAGGAPRHPATAAGASAASAGAVGAGGAAGAATLCGAARCAAGGVGHVDGAGAGGYGGVGRDRRGCRLGGGSALGGTHLRAVALAARRRRRAGVRVSGAAVAAAAGPRDRRRVRAAAGSGAAAADAERRGGGRGHAAALALQLQSAHAGGGAGAGGALECVAGGAAGVGAPGRRHPAARGVRGGVSVFAPAGSVGVAERVVGTAYPSVDRLVQPGEAPGGVGGARRADRHARRKLPRQSAALVQRAAGGVAASFRLGLGAGGVGGIGQAESAGRGAGRSLRGCRGGTRAGTPRRQQRLVESGCGHDTARAVRARAGVDVCISGAVGAGAVAGRMGCAPVGAFRGGDAVARVSD
eukprot:ctg_3102.g618